MSQYTVRILDFSCELGFLSRTDKWYFFKNCENSKVNEYSNWRWFQAFSIFSAHHFFKILIPFRAIRKKWKTAIYSYPYVDWSPRVIIQHPSRYQKTRFCCYLHGANMTWQQDCLKVYAIKRCSRFENKSAINTLALNHLAFGSCHSLRDLLNVRSVPLI